MLFTQTIFHKVFATNSSFHVNQRIMGKVYFLAFQHFCASINKIFILKGGWTLAYHYLRF